MTEQLRAYVNARLLDPASGLDQTGTVLIDGNKIIDIGPHLFPNGPPENVQVVDCRDYCLAPGLIDMRVHLPEPGGEHKESFETASAAAAAPPRTGRRAPTAAAATR
mgnify:CR=1 FL=1